MRMRAADDFAAIRSRMDELQREHDEVLAGPAAPRCAMITNLAPSDCSYRRSASCPSECPYFGQARP